MDDKSFYCIPKCTQDYPFLLIEYLECVSHCTIKQRQNNLCITYYNFSIKINYQIFEEVINQTRFELLNNFDESVVNGNIINENGDNITITRTQQENNNDDGIYLGECEERLKKYYNISENESLYVLRLDIRQIGYQVPSLLYEILYPIGNNKNLVKLNLTLCSDINLNITRYANIKGNIDRYNKNSRYYNDICYPSDSESGIDMTLSDKKEDYINNNLGICEDKCELISYNYETKKAVCSCAIKNEIHSINNIKIDKDTLLNSFTDINNIANIKLMKCYNIIFKKEYILKNIGFYIYACLIILDLILLLYFIINDYKELIKEINKIKLYFLYNKINKINNIDTNKIHKNKKLKMKLNTNIKKSNIKKLNVINKPSNSRKLNYKMKPFINPKNNKSNSNGSYKPFYINNTISHYKKYFSNIKKNHLFKLNYNELNDLPFKDALIKDKRNFKQYYLSLLRTKHSILYKFYSKDYNSKTIKASIQIFDLATLISVNALFFNDETMHKIYVDKGSFNFLYQLPQIIYSTIISYVLNTLIQLLGLTEENILEFKNYKLSLINLKRKYNKLKRIIRIKFIFFYFFNIVFLLLFWYYVTCFCGIYSNTQMHLLKDSLVSFITSLITPFCFYLIPGVFRILALKLKSKVLKK